MEYYKYENYDVTLSDCEFGDSWEAETACSKACGGGLQILTRTRARNASGNGLACQGENTRLDHCNENVCPWVIMIIVVIGMASFLSKYQTLLDLGNKTYDRVSKMY